MARCASNILTMDDKWVIQGRIWPKLDDDTDILVHIYTESYVQSNSKRFQSVLQRSTKKDKQKQPKTTDESTKAQQSPVEPLKQKQNEKNEKNKKKKSMLIFSYLINICIYFANMF